MSPNNGLNTIKNLTSILERLEYLSRVSLIGMATTLLLTGLILIASTVFFVIGVRTHAAHTEALAVLLQMHRTQTRGGIN